MGESRGSPGIPRGVILSNKKTQPGLQKLPPHVAAVAPQERGARRTSLPRSPSLRICALLLQQGQCCLGRRWGVTGRCWMQGPGSKTSLIQPLFG